ncbi:MAG: hypothetical protein WCR20_18840 [Verrucomicrobiota bacterium]
MKLTFKLKVGEILFDEDKIIIKDDAKKQKWYGSLITGMGTMILILFLLKSYKTGSAFEFWFELIFILVGIPVLTILFFRSVKSEISFSEVKSMKVRRRNGNKFLDINLKNHRLRRVIRVDNETELKEYIETNFKTT